MCGVPVIVSNRCGASILINDIRGRVFSIEKNDLKEVLQNFMVELPYNVEKRENIRNWALNNISGEAAAHYFIDVIKYITGESVQAPIAPWLKNKLC
jgi:hypothetical protein